MSKAKRKEMEEKKTIQLSHLFCSQAPVDGQNHRRLGNQRECRDILRNFPDVSKSMSSHESEKIQLKHIRIELISKCVEN